jgi:hypothetical protein
LCGTIVQPTVSAKPSSAPGFRTHTHTSNSIDETTMLEIDAHLAQRMPHALETAAAAPEEPVREHSTGSSDTAGLVDAVGQGLRCCPTTRGLSGRCAPTSPTSIRNSKRPG